MVSPSSRYSWNKYLSNKMWRKLQILRRIFQHLNLDKNLIINKRFAFIRNIRSEVFTALWVQLIRVVAPCTILALCHHFRKAFCLHHQGWNPDNDANTQNSINYLENFWYNSKFYLRISLEFWKSRAVFHISDWVLIIIRLLHSMLQTL